MTNRLGLSLSHDIIKAHSGVPITIGIKVETLSAGAAAQTGKEREGLSAEALAKAGTTFTIQLPTT